MLRTIRKRRSLTTTAAFCLTLTLLAGCSATASVPEETAAVPETTIRTEAVQLFSMGAPREQVAEVSASVRLDITALAGGKVVEVLKANGDVVREGDIIARFDARGAELQRKQAAAGVDSALKSLAKAQTELAASRAALENSLEAAKEAFVAASAQDDQLALQAARRNVEAAKQQLAALDASALIAYEGQVEASKGQLEQAELALENYSIVAPADGVLTDLTLTAGMTVGAGANVAVVQNVQQLTIRTELAEPAAALARGKQELVYYDADKPSELRRASVVYLADVPSAATRLYELKLLADGADGELKPGQRVQVQLTTEAEELVVAVPSLSIVREGADTFVYLDQASTAEKRPVQLGRVNGIYQEVLSGLKEGEQLVVSGQHTLKDGQAIKAESGD
jgi:multidrug efflux pump subunit AcrA (membrane-fusion protein)